MPVPLGVMASAQTRRGAPLGWISVPAIASNALRQVPDDNPVINDLILTARVALNTVPGSGTREICERWVVSGGGTNRFIWRFDATAHVVLIWSSAAVTITKTTVAAWPFGSGAWGWLRTTLDVDNGSSQNAVIHETSVDGQTWTAFETITTGGVTTVDAGSAALGVGNRYFGSALGLNGLISDLKIQNATTTLFEMHTEADLKGVLATATSFVTTSGHTVNVLTASSPVLTLVPPP
jgi:hypothetical protein